MIFVLFGLQFSLQKPAAPVVAVRDRQIDRQDAHFERVARFRAFDVDRSGQDVPAGPLVGDGVDHLPQRRLHVLRLDARALEPARRVRQQRVHVDDVARRDPQHRLRLGPVVAVGDGFRRRLEAVGCGL